MYKFVVMLLLGFAASLQAAMHEVSMHLLTPQGKTPIGTITLSEAQNGLVLMPKLSGLSPGMHGFHIHAKGSCEPSVSDGKTVLGGAAGGHYDPDNTGKHGHPWGEDNHKGDLPALYVDEQGMASYAVFSPRLSLDEVQGKSIMIHAGGDNHADTPLPLGGGGARMACGVI